MWLLGTHLSRQPKWILQVPSPANNSALFSPTSLPTPLSSLPWMEPGKLPIMELQPLNLTFLLI